MAISAFMTADKNRVSSVNAIITLFEISIPGAEIPARIADNNGDVIWRGQTWYAFGVKWDEILESSKGEIPRVDISFSNINRIMEGHAHAYDLYTKINGFIPISVSIYVVNSGNLSSPGPESAWSFELTNIRSSAQWITFTLGAPSPYTRRFPLDLILKNHGRVTKFKNAACGYVGAETTCDRTLKQCRAYGNSGRYCGFAGVGNTAVRL